MAAAMARAVGMCAVVPVVPDRTLIVIVMAPCRVQEARPEIVVVVTAGDRPE